ncbi:MAG: hypothetical protein ABFD20_10560 [Anaerolineales bacterium]
MNFAERMQAVLTGGEVDRVPFMSLESILPRGELELGLRRRGLGLCLSRPVVWCEYPHVNLDVQTVGDIATLTYHTPRGDLSLRQRQHLGRLADDASCDLDGLVKTPADLDAAIAMAEDAVFHVDASAYSDTAFEIGADGIVRCDGPRSPDELSAELVGYRPGMVNAHQVLTYWHHLQQTEPTRFGALLEALEAQELRRMEAVIASPVTLVRLGRIDGEISPARWRERALPFYQRVTASLRAAGKVCSLHAHAPNLEAYADAIGASGVQMVEGLASPPLGVMAVGQARRHWAEEIILWVNVPEALFWLGSTYVQHQVTVLAMTGEPKNKLIVGTTEQGLVGMVDDESEAVYRAGYHAILDGLGYPA